MQTGAPGLTLQRLERPSRNARICFIHLVKAGRIRTSVHFASFPALLNMTDYCIFCPIVDVLCLQFQNSSRQMRPYIVDIQCIHTINRAVLFDSSLTLCLVLS